jgi:hypothetical protein
MVAVRGELMEQDLAKLLKTNLEEQDRSTFAVDR